MSWRMNDHTSASIRYLRTYSVFWAWLSPTTANDLMYCNVSHTTGIHSAQHFNSSVYDSHFGHSSSSRQQVMPHSFSAEILPAASWRAETKYPGEYGLSINVFIHSCWRHLKTFPFQRFFPVKSASQCTSQCITYAHQNGHLFTYLLWKVTTTEEAVWQWVWKVAQIRGHND